MPANRPSNSQILTQGKHYADRRKLAAKDAVEKVVFDDDARAEFLTGFSKRKQAKLTEKREKAKERDRLEQAKEKREFRQARKEHAQKNFEAVERAYEIPSASSSSSHLFPRLPSVEPLDEEATYSDGEDQHATVTIVEDFDMDTSTALSFLPKTAPSSKERGDEQEEEEREERKEAPPLGRKPKMMSGSKKNKSGKKTLLRGTKDILHKKRVDRQKYGADDRSGRSDKKSSSGGRGGKGKK